MGGPKGDDGAEPVSARPRRHRPWARPDRRLQTEIELLRERLAEHQPTPESDEEAHRREAIRAEAEALLDRAERELAAPVAHNQEAWTTFHAARRKQIRLLSAPDLARLECDQRNEADEKLGSAWRKRSIGCYDAAALSGADLAVAIQQHLDETADNQNRKRVLRRRQLFVYLAQLVLVLLVVCVLEFRDRGLIFPDGVDPNGWWLFAAVLYGILGGAFSSAQRVASSSSSGRYPEHLWDQLAGTFRPVAGGAAALIAFAAVQSGVLGQGIELDGDRIALVAFTAGFSERFISSLVSSQE